MAKSFDELVTKTTTKDTQNAAQKRLEELLDEYDIEDLQRCNIPEKSVEHAAYFNWINAGCPPGRDLEFWFEAERGIFGLTNRRGQRILLFW